MAATAATREEWAAGLTAEAAKQGRLVVPSEQAAAHILVANIGVTLRQIILAQADQELSRAMREATLAAITGTGASRGDPLAATIEVAAANADVLGPSETQLLIEWLRRLNGSSSIS